MKVEYKNQDWQPGNVKGFSGKELLNQENGGVKLVRVSPDASYPIHSHPEKTEFMFVLDGKLSCTVEESEYICNDGDFVIFPIGLKHSIRNHSKHDALILIGSIKK